MPTELQKSFDPLPQQFLIDGPGIGGRIKQRPEDFLVDEQPLYQPCGEGEHLYLFIEKRNTSHGELLSVLQQHFNVREVHIGYAGMKDKVGITRQLVSVHLPPLTDRAGASTDSEAEKPLEHDRIRVLWAARHTHKLRRGHLHVNRFAIRIRDVDPLLVPRVQESIRRLEVVGVPNHFGFQRFGYRRNNHLLGVALLRGDWRAAIEEMLGTGGSPYPAYQEERRKRFDDGRYADALRLWSRSDRSECCVLRALQHGMSERDAILSVGKSIWSFWISALQSAIFNRVLDERIAQGRLNALVEGDLAWKHNTRRVFPVGAAEIASRELDPRLANFEISPSGPIWGAEMTEAAGAIRKAELEALGTLGIDPPLLHESQLAPRGTRRPLREQLSNPEIDSGIDEYGGYIRVAFDLPRGVYATIVLREIMKVSVDGEV